MSGFEAALSAIGKYSWRSMFGVFIATGVLLFFSRELGIYDWTNTYRGWLIAGFAVSGAVLLTYIGSGIYPSFASYVLDTRTMHIGKKHLLQLTEDEKVVCRHFVDHNGQSYRTDPAYGPVASLAVKNILFRPGAAYPTGLYDYQIQPWALKYLQANPQLLRENPLESTNPRSTQMEQQEKSSLFDRLTKPLGIMGFLLGLFSVGWQVYTYRESHEESPMVRASLTQELKGDHLQFNRDRHGELTIEVTNLGNRTMQIKTITLSAWKRVWVLHSPNKTSPTFSLETGHTLSSQIEWDYVKYPIFALNDASQPADFLVEVETTRAVHQQHVHINTITVTSTVP